MQLQNKKVYNLSEKLHRFHFVLLMGKIFDGCGVSFSNKFTRMHLFINWIRHCTPRYKTEAGDVADAFVPQVLRETDSEKMPSSADDFFAFENVSRPVLQPAYR
jgi:hypothetical protein